MLRPPLRNSPPAEVAGHLVEVIVRQRPPVLQFPAARLRGKQIQFRLFLGQDYVAEIDGLRVGWILSAAGPEGRHIWWWTVTGPSCGMARVNNVGRAEQLGAAQDDVRKCFTRWLDWALMQPGDIVWFGEGPDAAAWSVPDPDESARV